jgi:hypothetical protein
MGGEMRDWLPYAEGGADIDIVRKYLLNQPL